jgi:ABC-type transport system involved in multi-copper enzyme maturation permease subunit
LNAIAEPVLLAGAPARPARPSFAGAVRAELLKIGRQRLTWVLVAVLVIGCAVLLGSIAASGGLKDQLKARPLGFYFTYLSAAQVFFSTAAGVFLLVTGSRLVAMEYGAGTIRIVLGRGTGRLALLGAQLAAQAICGLLLLAGFVAVAAGFLYAMVVAVRGSFAPITSLPQAAWTDTWINLLVALVSIAACMLLATTAAVVGRSLAFGIGAALAFFPADNFGTIVMLLMRRLTRSDFWTNLTQYFFGPNLNALPVALQTDHAAGSAFATPFVQHLDVNHVWLTIGAYMLVFLAASVLLTWRRDVLA